MKKFLSVLFLAVFSLLAFVGNAQEAKKAPASPPATATGKVGEANITINYAQPAVKGREIWGSKIVPYNQVWRTGANNATVFTTDKDIMVEGKTLKAGKYALFTIPTEKEWTIIFNNNAQQWGAYSYSDKDDVLRVKVNSEASASLVERMTFDIKDSKVILTWEKLKVAFGVK